jgi:radical SAM superfamily enzyme YgiQ (UPF0313 family)
MSPDTSHNEKILMALLPYWTPLVPPLGISCLKSHLKIYGYRARTVDANIIEEFKAIYSKYFEVLKEYIPPERRGNFYNIGNDVLRNHMMAHINRSNKKEYIELVRILVYKTFFTETDERRVLVLNEIIDEFFTSFERYFLELLEKEQPDVLALSVYNGTLPASLFAFKLVKEKYPHIKTVMGGGVFSDQLEINSSNFKLFLEKTPYIDKIIVGEGEILFLKFLQGELNDSQNVYTLKDIGGEILDISTVEIPDFSDFNIHHYPSIAAYASRSCPFQCTFCSETVQWGKYRKKDADQIRMELMELYKKYDCQLFLMGDSLLNPVIHDLANELLRQETTVYWDGYLRADKEVGDIKNTKLWRRSGFYRARLGLESGSQRVLDMMAKKISVQQIKDAVSNLACVGIKTTTYWVVGYPGETEKDFCQTLQLIEELTDDIYEAECNPFNFYFSGQMNSEKWRDKSFLLYPQWAKDMLITRTWSLDGEPSREETYKRMCRFVTHCRKLGIPNPYSLKEIYQADERWKKLKKNAVPSLVNFKNEGEYIDECKKIVEVCPATLTLPHDEDWGF